MSWKFIANAFFGLDIDYDEFITTMIKSVHRVPSYIYGKQLMMEIYEEYFKIANHHDKSKPLSSVAYHPSEEYILDGHYETYVTKFAYMKVYEKLGLSFDEFMKLPRHKINSIFRALSKKQSEELKDSNDSMNQLEKIVRGK